MWEREGVERVLSLRLWVGWVVGGILVFYRMPVKDLGVVA